MTTRDNRSSVNHLTIRLTTADLDHLEAMGMLNIVPQTSRPIEPGIINDIRQEPIECHAANTVLIKCIICQQNQINTVNIPCYHACFCSKCASRAILFSTKCPVCRIDRISISNLYLSYTDVYTKCD